VTDAVLATLEAISAHPLSTRQGLRDAGTPVDESALRQAIHRGLVEVHVTGVSVLGEEERFTLTRTGLFVFGRNPDDAALLAELDQLERKERQVSDLRLQLHERLSHFRDAAAEGREVEVSAERKALHERIDALRTELGAAGYDVADPGPNPGLDPGSDTSTAE
jgi:hypothetical protein